MLRHVNSKTYVMYEGSGEEEVKKKLMTENLTPVPHITLQT